MSDGGGGGGVDRHLKSGMCIVLGPLWCIEGQVVKFASAARTTRVTLRSLSSSRDLTALRSDICCSYVD